MGKKNGIYCIETSHWRDGETQQPSVDKLLGLIEDTQGIPYIHRDFSTKEELEFLLTEATQKKFSSFPVIYVASHGEERNLWVRQKVGKTLPASRIGLDELREMLKGRGKGKILFFSACGLMKGNASHLKKFLKETGIKALVGYQRNVSWIESAQLELGLLPELANCATWHFGSLKKAFKKITPANRSLIKSLELRSYPNLLP